MLAAGTLGDRRGRRGMLVAGLAVFGGAAVAAALCTTADRLIAAPAAMGIGAATVYPTTLSILTNVFTERRERAAADLARPLRPGGFFEGVQAGCLVAAGACLAGAVVAALVLPAQPRAAAGAAPSPSSAG